MSKILNILATIWRYIRGFFTTSAVTLLLLAAILIADILTAIHTGRERVEPEVYPIVVAYHDTIRSEPNVLNENSEVSILFNYGN